MATTSTRKDSSEPSTEGAEMNPSKSFFGFESSELVEQAYEATHLYSQDGLTAMHDILRADSEFKFFGEAIDRGFEAAHTKLQRVLERNFDKFELYAQRNILRIPTHVDPKGISWMQDSGEVHTVEEEQALDADLADLRRKIQAAQFVNNTMSHRLAQYTSELAACRELISTLEEADKCTASEGIDDLPCAVSTVLEAGKEVAAVESQYTALSKAPLRECGDGNASVGVTVSLNNCLAQCRAATGAASTRELRTLGVVLGASQPGAENKPPTVM